jgi:hypothetical protein
MFSRGGINGSVINAFALNGGNFVEDAPGICSIAVAGAAIATRRARLIETAAAQVSAAVTATRRRQIYVDGMVTVNATAMARRRTSAAGTSSADITAAATAMRRVVASGDTAIDVVASAALFWKYRLPAPIARLMHLRQESRLYVLPAENRTVHVRRGRDDVDVARDIRRAA